MTSHRSCLEETSEQEKILRREPFGRGLKDRIEGTDRETYTPGSRPIGFSKDTLSSEDTSENKDTDSSNDFDENYKPEKLSLYGYGRGKPPQKFCLPKVSYSDNSPNMTLVNEPGSTMVSNDEPSPRRPRQVCAMPGSKRLSLTNKSKPNSSNSDENKKSPKEEKTLVDSESPLEPKLPVGFGRGKLIVSPNGNAVRINSNSSPLARSDLMIKPEGLGKDQLKNATVSYNKENNVTIENPLTKDHTPEEKSTNLNRIFGRGKLLSSLSCRNEKEVSAKASVVHKEPMTMSNQQPPASKSDNRVSLQQYVERVYMKDNTQEMESVEQVNASDEESITMEQFSDCLANAPLSVEMSRNSSSESLECVEEAEGDSSSSAKEPPLSDQEDSTNSNSFKLTKEVDSSTSEEKNDSFTLSSVTRSVVTQ
jgi:hypothetical protein